MPTTQFPSPSPAANQSLVRPARIEVESDRPVTATPTTPAPSAATAATARQETLPADVAGLKAEARGLRFSYGTHEVLKGLNIRIEQNRITALIGPSGCGKSTFLRCFNRMHDLYRDSRYQGEIRLFPDDLNLVGPDVDPIEVRMRISMVFQKPNPFPKSIFENVAFGLRLRGVRDRSVLRDEVEQALKGAAIWEETKDRLHQPANKLSGGQQQRLCIARSLASHPEIILFDEPTSALDPIATGKIEELMVELRNSVTIIVVTHNMQQAARVSDTTAFMYLGELVEVGPTAQVFQNPRQALTEQYVTGRFG